ncbi:YL1-domain-containing protein [Coniochaeta ligniaria NRRL 30616]|uniref:YL1-domain-containing protein n=1 Tax=Coniochaeta ligniaria NRRL 30616 TaxID=1408157 RepID=A0A1J7JVH6_9PEZI|nr:YL1-domain-containing protein [Coniochaeta ligniaria NRRL 30616]
MATEDDEPMRGESSDSGSDSASNSDDGDSGEVQKVEWLATTRAKRSTAGNRMKSMLANEEPAADDDDLELLFAEDGEDAGFTDAEKDDSDVHMDSSSDDEDADEGAEEDAGEKELERQAREKRNAQRKRKAHQAAIPVKFRKKVRIEQPPTASASPAPQAAPKPRPKKKSERASWLPTPAEMPTRASERQTTKLSKEQLHQQMIEREIKRKKVMEAMERKAKKMEALKKPPLTQAQRLAEAAAVEKRNAKSLNRWEEAEKQREEERLRKIAALQNRKLDGPVVTFWSGIQELDGDQMKNLGKMVAIEEKAPRKKRQSLAATQEAGDKADTESKPVTPIEGPTTATATATEQKTTAGGQPAGQLLASAPVQAPAPSSTPPPPTVTPLAPPAPAPTPPLQQPSTAPPPSDGPRFAPLPMTDTNPPTQQAPGMQPPAISPMQPPNTQYASPTEPSQSSQLQPPRGPMAPPPIPPPPPGGGFLAAPSMLGHPFGAPPRMGSQMPMMGMQAPNTQSNVLAAPGARQTSLSAPSPLSMPQPQPHTQPQPNSEPRPPTQGTNTAPSGPSVTQPNPTHTAPTLQIQPQTQTQPPTPLQPIQGKALPISPNTPDNRTPAPSEQGKVTRSCIILQNFDETAIKDKQVQTQILFGRKMNKLAKPAHPPLCVITNHPARYRDPKTGLHYYNSYAFKEIQRLHRGDYKWSRLLGAWVGSGTFAARGVPARFLDPSKPSETVIPPDDHQDQDQKGQEVAELKVEQKPEVGGAPVADPAHAAVST